MSAIKRKFAANQASTQLVTITTEQFFSVTPDLVVDDGCVCQVEVNFPASPTDDAIVAQYAQQNVAHYDIVPVMEFTIDNANDPSRITFVVKDLVKFRIGIRRSGTTDTITSADLDTRIWQWENV